MVGKDNFWTRPVWLVIGALLLLVLLIGIVMQQRQVDWQRSYEGDDQRPFGTELLRAQWPHLFPQAQIQAVDQSAFEHLVFTQRRGSHYVFINAKLPLYPESTRELLRFVQVGNSAFIAAQALPRELTEALQIGSHGSDFDELLTQAEAQTADSLTLFIGEGAGHRFPAKDAGRFFTLPESSPATVLGQNAEGRPDFLRVPYGQGQVWLYSHPNLLGNYYLLDSLRRPYLRALLSHLPSADTVLWDEYYKVANLRFRPDRRDEGGNGDRDEADRPNLLAYLFSQPALAWALSTATLGLLLYTLFEGKRKQRIIPELQPLPNTTVAFARTIGRLYFQHGDHRNVALKRIRVLLDHIRSAYFLPTQHFDPAFFSTLAGKSGLDEGELKVLFRRIERVQRVEAISEDALVELHQGIEWFYRESAR